MNLFLIAAASAIGCFGAMVAFTFAAQHGDIAEMVAKSLDKIDTKRLRTFSKGAFAKGSPAGSFSLGDLLKSGWAGVLFAAMAGLLTFLQNIQLQLQDTQGGSVSYIGAIAAGIIGTVIVAVQRWLSDNPR